MAEHAFNQRLFRGVLRVNGANQAAVTQGRDDVRQREDLGKEVRDQDDGFAVAYEGTDDLVECVRLTARRGPPSARP